MFQSLFGRGYESLKARFRGTPPRLEGTALADGQGPGPHHAIHRELVQEQIGMGDDGALVGKLLAQLERTGRAPNRHDALTHLLETHPRPHLVNYALCMEGFNSRREELRSFPTHVWMDITSVCSVECRFCKYTHDQLPKQFVTLEQIQSIDWLKYVRVLNLTAGTAEAITHPKFIEIFDWLRDTYPHLHLSLLTNGKTLNAKVVRALRERLDALHVSMNASSEADYNAIIKSGNWVQFDRNMTDMGQILEGASRPKLTASFVVTKQNSSSLLANLEYAARHRASLVLFHHFYPHYVVDIHKGLPTLEEKLGFDQTLYHHPDFSDEVFAQVGRRAVELGVEIQVPPPFKSERDVHIYFGARSLSEPPADCVYPWTNMYMLWGFKSKREEITLCCGLASDIGVYFDRTEIATIDGLRSVWNSPTMRAYRRTANGPGVNPICDLCRKLDRFDPGAVYPDQRDFFGFNGLPIPPHFGPKALPLRVATPQA